MKKTDILILLFSPTGRDPEAMIPLAWYLENVFHYAIKFGSMFDGVFLIDKYKPKALLLNNIGGASYNVKAASYAYDNGIRVITLTSEGLLRKKEMHQFIWGNNRDKIVNWHKMFVWSEDFFRMTQEYLPKYKETFDISGSTGIDRYKIYSPISRKTLLGKYKKSGYKKVITYAGFTFGVFFNQGFVEKRGFSKREVDFYHGEMRAVKDILLRLIRGNRDILFILKKHPGEDNLHMEIDYGWKEKNLLILDEQEPLVNLISVADLYLVYRSTTSFEAYALGKPVINIFPTKHVFYKQDDQQGNYRVKSYFQLQRAIEEFYKDGKIAGFEKTKRIRERLIKKKIGNDDGLNSWRTARKIDIFLKDQPPGEKSGCSIKGLVLHFVLKYNRILHILPRFKNSNILKCYNDFYLFYKLKDRYYPQIKSWYIRKIRDAKKA